MSRRAREMEGAFPAFRPGASLSDWVLMGKPGIALCAAWSAAAAALQTGAPASSTAACLAGVLLLALGAGALNEVQEREIDAGMARTRSRPLPAGRISPAGGAVFSLALLGSGLALLGPGGPAAVLLGAGAVSWYNGVYTPIKSRSALALFPGALVGGVPPAIGWVAGGGALSDPRVLALCGFLVLWQIPHALLFQREFAADLERGGLPSLGAALGRRGWRVSICFGLAAAGAAGMALAATPLIHHPLVRAGLLLSPLLLFGAGRGAWAGKWPRALRPFVLVNAFLLLVLTLVALDGMGGAPLS